jgi:3-hydroxybutyryl-CoA dehydrogenase
LLIERIMLVQTIGVVGCGMMGTGVAEVAAVAGFDVVAVKLSGGPLHLVAGRIRESLDRAVAKQKLTPEARDNAMARITFTADLGMLDRADLVIENSVESLADKRGILAAVEQETSVEAILATNTSSLRLARLAATLKRPQQFLGLHFFSPVSRMDLVEVAPLGATSAGVVATATSAIERMGKMPIRTCDDPGYIVNRLLVPYLCHAMELLENGVARAKDIDTAMRLGCGNPMGPLALSDFIGLDVVLAMAQSLGTELRDRRFRVPSLLRRLVLAGKFGRKTGVGLYLYGGAEPLENPDIAGSVRTIEATPADVRADPRVARAVGA